MEVELEVIHTKSTSEKLLDCGPVDIIEFGPGLQAEAHGSLRRHLDAS